MLGCHTLHTSLWSICGLHNSMFRPPKVGSSEHENALIYINLSSRGGEPWETWVLSGNHWAETSLEGKSTFKATCLNEVQSALKSDNIIIMCLLSMLLGWLCFNQHLRRLYFIPSALHACLYSTPCKAEQTWTGKVRLLDGGWSACF